MKGKNAVIFLLVAIAWIALVVLLLVRGGVTPYNVFVVLVSGVVVFVPMYKRYVKKND